MLRVHYTHEGKEITKVEDDEYLKSLKYYTYIFKNRN